MSAGNPTRRQILKTGALALALGAGIAPVRAAAPLSVVATTGMIADIARRLLGADGTVAALMGPGIDPHSYRVTRSAIVAMTRADLVLVNGLGLEAQLTEFLADLGARKPVLAVADGLDAERLLANPDHPGAADPHVWMDASLWKAVAGIMAGALAGTLADAGAAIEDRMQALGAELDALHAYAGAALASIPENARVLITAHDAFGYFGRAYGVEVHGIQGISTESEAGLQRIGALVDLLVERRVPAVFVETSVSERNVRALIEGAAARGHAVSVGGALFSDAMGAEGTYEGTYPGMIDHNVTMIARALGGVVPERGLAGRLGLGG
ncbi:MAG: zinc ABC transporter substrate-binding protein [Hyphomicrobiaceae bacterium]|nr:zinc ABC transporter substrate-binding protein [Hyphomicrobiaceae bacterium]